MFRTKNGKERLSPRPLDLNCSCLPNEKKECVTFYTAFPSPYTEKKAMLIDPLDWN